MTTSELGKSLKKFRESRNLTQAEMAKDMGVSITIYKKYESGQSAPSSVRLINLADAYKISVDYLLGRTDKHNPYDTPPMFKQMAKDRAVITPLLKEQYPAETLQARLARIESALMANGIQP